MSARRVDAYGQPALVRLEPLNAVLILDGWDYEIPLTDLGTHEGLIQWLRHLAEKTGVTKKHLVQLIDLVGKRNGWMVVSL